jgi:hypothetical protein
LQHVNGEGGGGTAPRGSKGGDVGGEITQRGVVVVVVMASQRPESRREG